jgi:hypothetical protein
MGSQGSGFYLNDVDATYFVTAKHVLRGGKGKQLGPEIELLSYSRETRPWPELILRREPQNSPRRGEPMSLNFLITSLAVVVSSGVAMNSEAAWW